MALARRFDQMLEQASNDGLGPFAEHDPITHMRIEEMVLRYADAGVFPPDRLARLTHQAIDLKLQAYLIRVDLGVSNTIYFNVVNADPVQAETPRMQLIDLAIQQTLIGKVRVLWERVINLVYYLETGTELKGRSKKRAFFKMVRGTERWKWLERYEEVLVEYDDAFRTPEFHQGSVLRKSLLSGEPIDPNELLAPYNYVFNNVWPNILEIVGGGSDVAEPWIQGDG